MVKYWLLQIAGLQALPLTEAALAPLVAFARREHLLSALALRADTRSLAAEAPEVFAHYRVLMAEARVIEAYETRWMTFEADRLERALLGTDRRVFIVKGAAYRLLKLKAGLGRRASDIDILVDELTISTLEPLLLKHGWLYDEASDNPRDQAYYRQKMHELPPLRHKKRQSFLDVHFRLLPKAGRYRIDHERMMQDGVRLDRNNAILFVFQMPDLFLHAAAHAFLDGDFRTPARTLLELYELYQALDDGERQNLSARANLLGVPLAYELALYLMELVFPSEGFPSFGKPPFYIRLLFKMRLMGNPSSQVFARGLLWLRGHWLRAPVWLIVSHQIKKMPSRLSISGRVLGQKWRDFKAGLKK